MNYTNLKIINYIDENLNSISKKFGFKKIYPKSISNIKLENKYYSNKESNLLKVIDSTGAINLLHEDPTISLFESELSKEKIYYLTNTFSWEKNPETLKGGIENFSNPSINSDAEVIVMAYKFLTNLGLKNFTIEIGHTHFIENLLNLKNINYNTKKEINSAIHNKNIPKIKKILNDIEIDKESKLAIISLSKLFGNYKNILEKSRDLKIQRLNPVIDYLNKLKNVLSYYDISLDKIKIDLSLTNKYSYYDGLVFKSYTNNFGKKLLQGGRYKNSDKEGIGFSFNIKELIGVIKMKNVKQSNMDYTVVVNDNSSRDTFSIISNLREKGFSVNITENKLNSQLIKNAESDYILEVKNDFVSIVDNLCNRTYKEKVNDFVNNSDFYKESIH